MPENSKTSLVLDASRQLTGTDVNAELIIDVNETEHHVTEGETPNPNPWLSSRHKDSNDRRQQEQRQYHDQQEYLSSDAKFAILVAMLVGFVVFLAFFINRVRYITLHRKIRNSCVLSKMFGRYHVS